MRLQIVANYQSRWRRKEGCTAGVIKLLWNNPVKNCEREAYENSKTSGVEERDDSFMSLSWALVHSKIAADVNRGIGMLQVARSKRSCSVKDRENRYLLALGHYRTGSYSDSRQYLEECLEIEPDWEQAIILQKLLTQRTKKDGTLGLVLATGIVGAFGFAVAGMMGAIGAVALAAAGVLTMARRT